ncbi:MAG TPA: BREX-1 system adenine-specific DNA-methyltransferase PglX [Pirellulales bacterium]|nr:BREX-1 system adenine-specific DNA-methyltransferase PglX [Pirellulales bacterium]
MNRAKLKTYAPQARRDFIQAMTDRAAFYGLTANKIEPILEHGDVALIAGRDHPRAVAKKRKQLEDRINRHGPDWCKGFGQTMEALAYTWFNRLVAVRFMELHGYLDHGYRVLSARKPTTDNTDGTDKKSNSSSSVKSVKSVLSVVTFPEILEHAEHVDLPGLKKETVIDLKLAGNKEAELYRLLLTAQCNALHTAMPFLFERIDDETELLLPDNLLHSDSLVRKLAGEIDEDDWREVEIIGWLYQFYISDKKAEVIGKVVASEDIPAATQLFTPNWIVKYLVQNTLGRQWLATYPQSALRQQMEYYIEPAEQTLEVQEQLKAITPTSLDPEELTLLDPACGSGHILVEAYELFKAIYQERGYRAKDIPALILRKNLFGMEIDDRAAQLAAFALMMKARADDRRIFDKASGAGDAPVIQPNILAFQDSQGMNAADITHAINSPILKEKMPPSEYLIEEIEDAESPLFSKKVLAEKGHVSHGDVAALLELFENAKTFGSLIQVPTKLAAKRLEIELRLNDVLKHGDLTHAPAHVIAPLLQQARLLAKQYDAVVANPPYMGRRNGMNSTLKTLISSIYPHCKADIYAAFLQLAFDRLTQHGITSMVTMQSWMFLSSYQGIREEVLRNHTLMNLAHLGPRAFSEIPGEVVQVATSTILNSPIQGFVPTFFRLVEDESEAKRNRLLAGEGRFASMKQDAFLRLPDCPLTYWLPQKIIDIFSAGHAFENISDQRQGLATGDDERFIRCWHEVSLRDTNFNAKQCPSASPKWYPFIKGGSFRKWYGNNEHVIRFDQAAFDELSQQGNCLPSRQFYLRESLVWSDITSCSFGARFNPCGRVFATGALSAFPHHASNTNYILAYLNSVVHNTIIGAISSGIHYSVGYVDKTPICVFEDLKREIDKPILEAIQIGIDDWNDSETSWDFQTVPSLHHRTATLQQSQEAANAGCLARFSRMKELEEENNRLFIEAYGLQDELSPEVPDDQITLYRPDREEDIKRLLSYAIGCMMGRYSLDKPGLIYAHSGNQGFDPGQYKTFRADGDGIIPLLETDWGIRDDAANRTVEFIGVAWPGNSTTDKTDITDDEDQNKPTSSLSVVTSPLHLEENLKFIADSLGPTSNEQPRDTIRRYLSNPGAGGFYKHHLSMYKKRPIYWLFASGKQRAFQCLVYLHRYHEGTLARMRTEYVIPLQGQIAGRIEQLEGDKAKATSSSHRKNLQKEQDGLKKQQTELHAFEEKLKHAADQKISLDLDDGVKVNYGKFGDLLAEVRAITGGKDEE